MGCQKTAAENGYLVRCCVDYCPPCPLGASWNSALHFSRLLFLAFASGACYLCLSMMYDVHYAFSALTLLVGQQEGHPACKKTEWWSAGVVICLEQGADLHMAQLMPLPLTVSCFSEIQTGFTFLVLAHPGNPGQRAIKWVCVCTLAPAGKYG